jgi:hypothetical protein
MPPAPPLSRKIALRIDTLLQRELGQGIDVQRMLAQPMYARDVLLVCDALRGSDLALLAQQFRDAAAQADEAPNSQPGSLWPDSVSPSSIWPHTWFGGAKATGRDKPAKSNKPKK